MKRRIVVGFQKYVLNPLSRPLAGFFPGLVLLETTGRRSGLPRRTPVGGSLDGDKLWITAEHGRGANYVRNIEGNPTVRVRVRGAWREGKATLLPDEDPRRHLRFSPNDIFVRLVGTELLTIRVDLSPAAGPEARA